jgi:fluoroacetyl-CoA thioesterase
VDVTLTEVDGRRLAFAVRAHDGVDAIGEGTHERFVIDHARFVKRLQDKIAKAP